MQIEIKELLPTSNEARRLFKLLDEHNTSHCPPEVCHLTQPEEMLASGALLLGVYCDEQLRGMGGLKFLEGYAEITRMFLEENVRGSGLAEPLLDALAERARQRNYALLKLETSDKFERAVHLYEKYGFTFCTPFGEYVSKPYNTYMELHMENANVDN